VKEFWAYTGARVGLFLLCYAVMAGAAALIWGGPVPLLWPLVAAALLSSVLSLVLLGGMRTRFNAAVQQRAERMSRRFEESRSKEDVD
jgi:membrane protein implicated in regulation of membrane protease activity